MKIIGNKKGQGSDTFKLLIAAVVAMVILGIVTGVFQNIVNMVTQLPCVGNPVNEMVTKIQRAQGGITTLTDAICMKPGEAFTSEALTGKIGNLQSVTFTCPDAAICKNQKPIDVSSSSMIKANGDAKFKGLITCTPAGGDYSCVIVIQSAG